MSSNGLVGRNAVITGGSRGIGAAVARQLHAAGAEIVIAARTANQLDEVAASLSGRVHATTCDVSNADSVAALASFASDRLERIDILVNNAGVASSAPLHHQTLEEWERLFAVNVRGTFLCTQAFVPAMVKRSWGRVVNVASLAARTGARYISAYAASKHAVLGFTRSIAAEVAERGVTVNALCPGYVDTDMTVDTVERIMCKTGMSREEALASILQSTPQQRLITADEVAYMAVCLCDEQARGINGQAIGLDGGEFLG